MTPAVERDAPIAPDVIYSHIGGERKAGESSLGFLQRVAERSDSAVVARDYFLMALLAERRLVDFTDRLFEFYNVSDCDRLPKHYKEALMLYAHILPSFDVRVDDGAMRARFDAMMQQAAECGGSSMSSYLMRLSYGDTYWWYFLYGE